MPLTDADALDPLVVAPVIHEPLTWPGEGPRRRGGYDAEKLRRTYPYRFFVERPHEEGLLRLWLQGAPVDGYAVMYDKDALDRSALGRWLAGSIHKPLPGGASLVTGLRGVGKTTLVRKVLFDVAVAARHGIRLDPRVHICDALARAPSRPRTEEQWLYVPVRIDVASPISGDQLMRRIIRRTYLALAAHGVGDLHPEMMRQARTSYLRTLGELSESASESLSEALGLKTDLLAKLEVTAEQELAFARSLELVAKQLSVEEAEDELIDLGRTLAGPPLGQSPGVLRAAWVSTNEASAQVWARLRESLSGKSGVRVFLVYLVDELDKMPPTSKGDAQLGTALAVLRRLKTLMTVEGVMAIAIGGHVVEQHWNDDRFRLDADLRSIFSRHVYVPKLKRAEVAAFLARRRPTLRDEEGDVADGVVDAACFVTRGRYKDLLRWAARHSDPLDRGLPPALGRIIGEWGAPPWSAARLSCSRGTTLSRHASTPRASARRAAPSPRSRRSPPPRTSPRPSRISSPSWSRPPTGGRRRPDSPPTSRGPCCSPRSSCASMATRTTSARG